MTKIRDELICMLWRGRDPFDGVADYAGPSDLQGWASQHRYLEDAIANIRPGIIAEIGVWKGASALHMAAKLKSLDINGVVLAIDTWLGSWDHWVHDQWFEEICPARGSHPSLFHKFLNNIKQQNLSDYIVPVPLDSINALRVLDHFNIRPDMVHVDAGHDYEAVTSDLRHWWPALKPGGILIGDDYRAGNDWPDVKQAFDDYFEPIGLTPIKNIDDKCILFKPDENRQSEIEMSNNQNIFEIKLGDFGQIAADVAKWREECRVEFSTLAEDPSLALPDLITQYITFFGPKWDGIRYQIMDKITIKLNETGIFGTRHHFFTDDGALRKTAFAQDLTEAADKYLAAGTIGDFESYELLKASANPFCAMALPEPINKNMAKFQRPPLKVYKGEALDLFVSPLGFQLCDEKRGVYWPSASTRAYSSDVFDLPSNVINASVVIIQDSFEGTNLSHFLFDWLPRLSHFIDADIEIPSSCLFLMGGVPSGFHALLIESMCTMHDLDRTQFIFPRRPEMWRLTKAVYFFSDTKMDIMHPAHMAHERSIALIRRLADSIKTSERVFPRIYISRSDTPLRRLANEQELWQLLKPLGFVMVRWSDIGILEQIALIRGAEVVVAPHGMGLTHIGFHSRQLLVIELHNPRIGTDAYAFVARALGFRYHAIIGESIDPKQHHFTISVANVSMILRDEAIIKDDSSTDFPAVSSGIRTKWFSGVQKLKAHEAAEVPPLYSLESTLKHILGSEEDNNVGWIEARELSPDLIYSAACEVWIPKNFRGERLVFQSLDLNNAPSMHADLTRRDEWQTLSVVGTARSEVANFVLRLVAAEGEFFFSTHWRVDIGAAFASNAAQTNHPR